MIYAYWEGTTKHWYYDLCWQTVLKWNPRATLLSRSDVEAALGQLPKALDSVYITHRVDWIRKKWIATFGGVWLDHDFVCWQPLDWLETLASTFDYVGYKEWHGTGWMDNLFAARKGSSILECAADYAMAQIERFGTRIQWLATNAHAMNHAVEKHKWGYVMQIPTHLVSPISVMERDWFASEDPIDIDQFAAFGQITSFHGHGDWIKARFSSPDELLRSRCRLAAVFRRAFA
ncbi:MAG: hypothetical protein QXZ09_09875 [Candidatus Methanomethylicaceae archaeon]